MEEKRILNRKEAYQLMQKACPTLEENGILLGGVWFFDNKPHKPYPPCFFSFISYSSIAPEFRKTLKDTQEKQVLVVPVDAVENEPRMLISPNMCVPEIFSYGDQVELNDGSKWRYVKENFDDICLKPAW